MASFSLMKKMPQVFDLFMHLFLSTSTYLSWFGLNCPTSVESCSRTEQSQRGSPGLVLSASFQHHGQL